MYQHIIMFLDGLNGDINNNQNEILKLIESNKNITQKQISEISSISKRTVERSIRELKKKNIIQIVGSNETTIRKHINNVFKNNELERYNIAQNQSFQTFLSINLKKYFII